MIVTNPPIHTTDVAGVVLYREPCMGPCPTTDRCCSLGCDSGACETCPCCCAGWCVMGTDGLPADAEDQAQWFEIAVEYNPLAAAVRAGLDLADELERFGRGGGGGEGAVYRDVAARLRAALSAPLAGQNDTDEETER